jgi:hypothetical protein
MSTNARVVAAHTTPRLPVLRDQPLGETRPRPQLPAIVVGSTAEQLCLPYEYEVAPGIPAVPAVPAHVLAASPPPLPTFDPRLKNPREWAGRMARALAEVAIGARPPGQLSAHVQRDELARLARRGQWVARHPSARNQRGIARLRVVRKVVVCPVADGVVECAVVLDVGQRAQAVALRMEDVNGHWLVTAVQLG